MIWSVVKKQKGCLQSCNVRKSIQSNVCELSLNDHVGAGLLMGILSLLIRYIVYTGNEVNRIVFEVLLYFKRGVFVHPQSIYKHFKSKWL